MRRILITLALIAAVIIGAPARISAGGGWSVVKLDSLPTDVVAGETTTIRHSSPSQVKARGNGR